MRQHRHVKNPSAHVVGRARGYRPVKAAMRRRAPDLTGTAALTLVWFRQAAVSRRSLL